MKHQFKLLIVVLLILITLLSSCSTAPTSPAGREPADDPTVSGTQADTMVPPESGTQAETLPPLEEVENEKYQLMTGEHLLVLSFTEEWKKDNVMESDLGSVSFADAAAYREKLLTGDLEAWQLGVMANFQKNDEGGILLPHPDDFPAMDLPEGYELGSFSVSREYYAFGIKRNGKGIGTISVYYGPRGTYPLAENMFKNLQGLKNAEGGREGTFETYPCQVYEISSAALSGFKYHIDLSEPSGYRAQACFKFYLKSTDSVIQASETIPYSASLVGETKAGTVYSLLIGPSVSISVDELTAIRPAS